MIRWSPLVVLLLAAPASAQGWRATYAVTAAGVTVMDAEVRFTLGQAGAPYAIETQVRSRGVAAMFVRAESTTRSEGQWQGDSARPRLYQSTGTWRGNPRRTRLEYGADGVARIMALEPAQDQERTPVPDDARRGALDALSAVVQLTGHVRRTARCDIQARTFDGRRLTQFDVTTDTQAEAGTLRCLVESRPLAGVPTDRPLEETMRPTRSVLVFGVAQPGAPAIPVRVEIASRWWGTIQARLLAIEPVQEGQ
jgi:hypothetical protein